MRRQLCTSAFSGVDEQSAALEQWKTISNSRLSKLRRLTSKISSHKRNSEENAKLRRWIFDRDSLHNEQATCEANLEESLHTIGHLLDDEYLGAAAYRRVLGEEIKASLNVVAPFRKPQPSIDNHACVAEHVSFLKDLLTSEMQLASRDLESCSCSEINVVDIHCLDDVFSRKEAQVRQLESRYPSGYSAIHELFQRALDQEKTRALERVYTEGVMVTLSTPPSTLSSVMLILKMTTRTRGRDAASGIMHELRNRVGSAYRSMSQTEINSAVEDALQLRKQQVALRCAARDFRRACDDLLSMYEAALETQCNSLRFDDQLKKDSERREGRQMALREQLTREREAYEARCRMKEAESNARLSVQEKAEERKRARLMEELQARLEKLADYEKAKAVLREREEELESLRQHEEELLKAERMEKNMERVNFRHRERQEKLAQQQRAEEDVKQLQLQKEAALKRFFDSIDRHLGTTADPGRVLQSTESSSQTESYVTFAAAGKPPVRGYTDADVMRDPRVRLFHALLEAGLHTTSYGREVITRNYNIPPAQVASEENPFRGNY